MPEEVNIQKINYPGNWYIQRFLKQEKKQQKGKERLRIKKAKSILNL